MHALTRATLSLHGYNYTITHAFVLDLFCSVDSLWIVENWSVLYGVCPAWYVTYKNIIYVWVWHQRVKWLLNHSSDSDQCTRRVRLAWFLEVCSPSNVKDCRHFRFIAPCECMSLQEQAHISDSSTLGPSMHDEETESQELLSPSFVSTMWLRACFTRLLWLISSVYECFHAVYFFQLFYFSSTKKSWNGLLLHFNEIFNISHKYYSSVITFCHCLHYYCDTWFWLVSRGIQVKYLMTTRYKWHFNIV